MTNPGKGELKPRHVERVRAHVTHVDGRTRRTCAAVKPVYALALVLGVIPVQSVGADPCVDYRKFVHATAKLETPTTPLGVAATSGRAYVAGGGASLLVVDVTNPYSPIILGQMNTPGTAKDVALAGAYVLVTDGGLRVVDVSNPAAPQIVGALDMVRATEIATMGNIAFVAADLLRVVDVSVPSSPQLLTTIPSSYQGSPIPSFPMQDVAVVGSKLYALSFDLQIFDVTDPGSPTLLGTWTPSDLGSKLAIVGDMAYVGSANGPTSVIDVSNPATPTFVSAVYLGGGPENPTLGIWTDLVVSGNHAFVGYGNYKGPLLVFDVSQPESPVAVGAAPTGTAQLGVAVSGEHLFAVGQGGISIVDIQPPISPPPGHVDTPGNARGVALAGTHAYVADETSLQVVDVSDRFAPVIVGSVSVEASVVAVDGDLAIVAGGGTTHVVDISNPTMPVVVGSLPGGASDVELVGSRAYRADGNLDIIDVANPASPALLGSSSTAANRVEVDGPYAYTAVANGQGQIWVFDVTGNVPALVGTTMGGEYCLGFAQEGQRVFCSDPTHGYVWVYDVGNPAAPSFETALPLAGGMGADAVSGLYVATQTGELWVVPEIPVAPEYEVAAFGAVAAPLPYGGAIESAGGLVLVPAGTQGLYVLPAHCEVPTDVVEASPRHGLAFGAWPTPSRGPLSLRFALPRAGAVHLRVYDVAGRRLRDIVQRWYPAGAHVAAWDGRDDRGREVVNGVYHVQLTTSAGTSSTRVVIVH